jgi:integrase/recombinase XerD
MEWLLPQGRKFAMNAKQELAGRIMMLVCDEIRPDSQRVLDILSEYHIEYNLGIEDMDFLRQVNHFIGAKKSEGLSPKSTDNYRMYLHMFSGYTNKKSADATANDIRSFISYLSIDRGLKNTSVQSVINILRSFFGWLTVEEIIIKNPMLKIKSFKIDKICARHPLSTEEMEILRDTCKDYREKAIVEFLYSSGCRISEATQIDVSSINFDTRSVEIIGKGSKRRTLYFSVRSRLMIRQYLLERKGGTALFVGCRKPHDRLGNAAIQKIIRELGKRAGLSKRIHPHIFRHTLATDCLNAGMDITVIQQILGHNSVGSTEIYASLSQDSIRREYEKYVA